MAANLAIIIAAQDVASGTLDKITGKVDRFGLAGKAAALGLAGLAVAVGAVGVGLGASIKTAADFEQALADTASATGATADEMRALRKEALGIGKDTSKSVSEAVRAMGELVRAGMSTETVIHGAARAVVQLSEATGSDVTRMATLVSNAMNTFKRDSLGAADAANLVAKAANASAIGTEDIAFALQMVGPVAAQAGLSMKDFSIAIGLMGNNALRGSDAGTSLKTMLLALTAPSKDAAAELKKLGVNVFDASGKTRDFRDIIGSLQISMAGMTEQQKAATLATIFGSDAVRAANILIGEGTQGWDEFAGAMGKAPSVAEQSATRLNTLWGVVEQIKGTIETLAINIGSQFVPALKSIGGMALSGLNALVDLDWSFIERGLNDVGTAITGFANLALPKLQVMVDAVLKAFATGGIGGVGQLVAKAVGDAWPAISVALSTLGGSVVAWAKDTAAPAVLAALGSWKDAFLDWVPGAWNGMSKNLGVLWAKFSGWAANTVLPGIIGKIEEWRVAFVNWVGPAWDGMAKNLAALWNGFSGWFGETTPKVWANLTGWKDQFVGWVIGVWPGMIGNLRTWWGAFAAWFQETDGKITEQTKAWEASIGRWITNYVVGGQMGKDLDSFGNALAAWLEKDGLTKFIRGISSMFTLRKEVVDAAGKQWGGAMGAAAGDEFGPAFGRELSRQFQEGGALRKAIGAFLDAEMRAFFEGLGRDQALLDELLRWWENFRKSIPGIAPSPGTGGPSVPRYATGGIVTRPTLALVGERGPEAIMPLGRGITRVENHYHFDGATIFGYSDFEDAVARANERNTRRGRAA